MRVRTNLPRGPIATVIFLAIGIAFIVGGGVLYWNQKSFLATAVQTEATVIELVRETKAVEKKRRSSSSSDLNKKRIVQQTVYRPRFRFSTQNGEPMEVLHKQTSKNPTAQVGERVAIYYDPANPYDIVVNKSGELWGGVIALVIIGCVVACLPVLGKIQSPPGS